MKKSIIITSVIIAGLGVATLSTFAASGVSTQLARPALSQSGGMMKHMDGMKMGGMMGREMGGMAQMTDAEKTAFEKLSDTGKRAALEKRRVENGAKRSAHEAVVDKLLAGTTLTADEEKIRAEIITQRAEMKKHRAEMEANRTKMEAIRAKQQAGTTLTADEQKLLDSMPQMGRGQDGKQGQKMGQKSEKKMGGRGDQRSRMGSGSMAQ